MESWRWEVIHFEFPAIEVMRVIRLYYELNLVGSSFRLDLWTFWGQRTFLGVRYCVQNFGVRDLKKGV